jgi:hypothetical protein
VSFSKIAFSQSSETITIARTINRDAASDILPTFLGGNDYVLVRSHGCWCAKLANPFQPSLGGPTIVDELDQICKEWATAGTCLHTQGGSCHQYKGSHFLEMNVTTNGENEVFDFDCEGIANGDDCLQDACKIHGHFATEIQDYLQVNEDKEAISTDQQFCVSGQTGGHTSGHTGGSQVQMEKWCVGDAPNVFLVNAPGLTTEATTTTTTAAPTTTTTTTAAPLPCASDPCQNSGVCSDSADFLSFTCDCSAIDFTGSVCETPIPCARAGICHNSGVCSNSQDFLSYSCDCSQIDFAGDNRMLNMLE